MTETLRKDWWAAVADELRRTDWAEELAAATARYNATPRWRFFYRRAHRHAIESCLWFLEQQEAGRL